MYYVKKFFTKDFTSGFPTTRPKRADGALKVIFLMVLIQG